MSRAAPCPVDRMSSPPLCIPKVSACPAPHCRHCCSQPVFCSTLITSVCRHACIGLFRVLLPWRQRALRSCDGRCEFTLLLAFQGERGQVSAPLCRAPAGQMCRRSATDQENDNDDAPPLPPRLNWYRYPVPVRHPLVYFLLVKYTFGTSSPLLGISRYF